MRLSMILPLLLAVGVVESLRGAKTTPDEPASDPPVPDERVESISHDEQTYRAAADGAPSAPILGADGEHNPDFDADALGAAGAETWDAEEHERKMNAMLHEGFPKWDLDSDGKLSRDEVQHQLQAVAEKTRENEKKRTKADATDAFGKLTDPHSLDADKDRARRVDPVRRRQSRPHVVVKDSSGTGSDCITAFCGGVGGTRRPR